MNATDTMVGGHHYTDMKIQPAELAMVLGATPMFCKVAKYCTRKKDDMSQQVDKALHCIEFEKQFSIQRGLYVTLGMNFVVDKITGFTSNPHLQNTLIYMYKGEYASATKCLTKFKSEIEGVTL